MASKSNNRRRITLQLPPDIDDQLKNQVAAMPGATTTSVILDAVRNRFDKERMTVDDLMPIIAPLSVMLDQIRDSGSYDDEHMATARLLYEGVLEKILKLPEDGQ